MTVGNLYLALAAVLIFGAGAYAARKAFPRIGAKQVALIAVIALLTVGLIWTLLSFATKRRDNAPVVPTSQPTPLLQPDQN